MCIERISHICNALKIEAALASGDFDYINTLNKRRKALELHNTILKWDTSGKRLKNQDYIEYWCFVTEGYCALTSGDFRLSKDWFQKALKKGELLDEIRCFPNYFRNIKEIEAHQIFIDAIAKFKEQQFGDSYALFEKWLHLNPERKGNKDLRYDNIQIFSKICQIIEGCQRHEIVQREDWKTLDEMYETGYVANPTWALQDKHLYHLRGLSFRIHQENRNNRFQKKPLNFLCDLLFKLFKPPRSARLRKELNDEITSIAQDWEYLLPDVTLLREDKLAGLKRRVALPSFIDIFEKLDPVKHSWKQILIQNLKNVLLMMADYEYKRCHIPSSEGQDMSHVNSLQEPTERMAIPELIQIIPNFLDYRSSKKKGYFEKALRYMEKFHAAIEAGKLGEANKAQMDFLDSIRFWPHIIYVEEQREIPKPMFWDEDNPNFLAYETIGRRIWNRNPNKIEFEGPQILEIDSYYYLRPRWNVRSYERYRIRHENFHQSDLPRWINVFFENIFGKIGKKNERFQKWILQFDEKERLLACRLFEHLDYIDEDRQKKIWIDVFKKLPAEAKTDVAYIGLGHGAKSGKRVLYDFRQAIEKLPEYEILFAGKEKKIFRELSEFQKIEFGLKKPKTVVFFDDFIGTGGQAKQFLGWYHDDKHPETKEFLEGVTIYFCVLVGFRKAIEEKVKKPLEGLVKDVIAGIMLEEKDKAFSPDNPIWKSVEECETVKAWAEEIGRQVLPNNPLYDSERDALGWHGCQALVAFPYNIPSDTLPIFWGTGERNGKLWACLLERHD